MITKKKLKRIVEIARECSECAMLHFSQLNKENIGHKIDMSPVTEGDIAVNEIAVTGLQKLFPEIIIVSEEFEKSHKQFKNNNTFWLIDPIDGTKEYINRSPNFTVNLALVKDQEPIFGIIAQPFTGIIWFNFNEK